MNIVLGEGARLRIAAVEWGVSPGSVVWTPANRRRKCWGTAPATRDVIIAAKASQDRFRGLEEAGDPPRQLQLPEASSPTASPSSTSLHQPIFNPHIVELFAQPVQFTADSRNLYHSSNLDVTAMAGRRVLTYGGLTAAAAAGYYLYQAGGDPKVAEKKFESM